MAAAAHDPGRSAQLEALSALRELLAREFPSERQWPAAGRITTGCTALDDGGGLRRGVLTEICGPAAGSQLLIAALLDAAVNQGFFLGLIDGADAFEPADWPEEQLARMLWVRSRTTAQALKAADLLVRDANLPVIVLDLQLVPARELRRISLGTWHRFHRVVESSASTLLVLTPGPLIESVPVRIATARMQDFTALHRERTELIRALDVRRFERRAAGGAGLHIARTAQP